MVSDPLVKAIELLRAAGYVVAKDEGLYCPRCGAPDPNGYTEDTLDG